MNAPVVRGWRGSAAVTLALALCAATALAYSALPGAWKNWRYSRAIDLPATEKVRLVAVPVADEVYLRSQCCMEDWRIIDAQGNEVPYTSFVLDGATKRENVRAILHENSFAPGEYTQTVTEIAGDAPFHNLLEVLTPEQNFIEWASVEASDDAHTWRIVQERAPIFRFAKDGREGTQVISYSENNARFLRVRIFDGDKQFPVTGVAVWHQKKGPEERRVVEVGSAFGEDVDAQTKNTQWSADMEGPGIPISEIRFEVGPTEFIRRVSFEGSNDRKEWTTVASGQIYRFRQGDKVRESLTVPVNSPGGSNHLYYRVTVENGNDAPLPNVSVQLYTTPRHLVFEQQPGKNYSLLYGQERAPAAQYDLGQRVDVTQHVAAVPGELGPEEVNAGWVDPRPWTETHEIFLWGVLVIAVLVIGSTAIRSMGRAAAEKTKA